MKRTYIQPQLQVIDFTSESVLTTMSANSGRTTSTVWTNKKGYTYEDSYTNPIWGQEEEEE